MQAKAGTREWRSLAALASGVVFWLILITVGPTMGRVVAEEVVGNRKAVAGSVALSPVSYSILLAIVPPYFLTTYGFQSAGMARL